ncbi:hypothetical protein IEQ34_007712 [Dendrobium chrysotoxum]|uniref:Cation/H+ exchanger domain-containing protein n=1 Tax=Dendrobium chrysotoxum TaxID=161865 RepID=A0AAV7H6I1_DENCH|nr:hypothetical protein IEQ34_007712 [Dendrobium chrysotoxum]
MATTLLSPLDLLDLCKQEQREDIFTDVSTIAFELSLLITFSHMLHFFLKRLGQPSVVSQMLAGIMIGKSFLGHLPLATKYLNISNQENLTSIATMSRMLFMFLVGLELDPPYLLRNIRRAIIISYSGAACCASISLAATPLVYNLTNATGSKSLFALALALVLSSTASPVVIRVATELKLTMTESGRLLIASSLINDMTCLLFVAVISIFSPTGIGGNESSAGSKLFNGAVALTLIGGSLGLVRPGVKWLNRRNKDKGGIRGIELVGVLMFVMVISCVTELMGYNSTMASFLLGLMFPRTGATVRTVMGSLSYFVHNFVVPVYFGYAGVQTDLTMVRERGVAITVVVLIAVGTAGKIGGTMIGGRLVGMTVREGLILGLLLNVKGHVDMILISIARKYGIWGQTTYMVFLITVLLNNIMAGPAAAFLINQERKTLKYRSMGLEWLNLDKELRVLACLHSPQDAPTILNLLEISAGSTANVPSSSSPLAAYLLHLLQLTPRLTSTTLYHQRIDHHFQKDLLPDQTRQIDFAADAFVDQTSIPLRQINAISSYDTMHLDICRAAQDIRASLIILPFHRRLRLDGRLGFGKEGIRLVNRRTLRHAPCTVGILVDRGMSCRFVEVGAGVLHKVAVVFIGGADDREAMAYGGRLAMHPCVSVTVYRLLGEDMEERDNEDEDFVRDFERRFAATGMVWYVEKEVRDGMETVEVLMGMEGKYSLYVVGKGRRWGEGRRITEGMGEWEGEGELGEIGDLLASSEFMSSGSVLVMKQHQLVEGRREELGMEEEELVEGK